MLFNVKVLQNVATFWERKTEYASSMNYVKACAIFFYEMIFFFQVFSKLIVSSLIILCKHNSFLRTKSTIF